MQTSTNLKALQERLLAVRKRVVVLELRLECLRILAGRYTDWSEMGWLFSINANAGGTVAAVLNGMHAGGYSDEASEVQGQLLRLVMDQKLLEHRIADLAR